MSLARLRRRAALLRQSQLPSTTDKVRARAQALPRAKDTIEGTIVERVASRGRVLRTLRGDPPKELDRILELPVKTPLEPHQAEILNRSLLLATPYESGFRLFPPQVEAMRVFQRIGAGFFPIAVGWGKTLICLMCAHYALTNGADRVLLLVPSQVLNQLVNIDLAWARERVPMGFREYVLGNKTSQQRKRLIAPQRRGLYIMPYSLLSSSSRDHVPDCPDKKRCKCPSRTGETELREIDPDLIIADEVHNLSDRRSARTRRLFDFVEDREVKPRFVGLSGTITDKSIKDYHALIKWALGDLCPLPRTATELNTWALMLDSGMEANPDAHEMFHRLRNWAQKHVKDPSKITPNTAGLRRAYQHRLTTCPGVFATNEEEIGVSLVFSNFKDGYDPGPKLLELIKDVEETWTTPNGDEIDHAIHSYKWLYELNAGFYNELVWPSVEVYAKRRGLDEVMAGVILDQAKEYHFLSQEYAKELRQWIQENASPGLDTPFLIGGDMSHHQDKNVGRELYQTWKRMKDQDFEGRPDRDARAVRVDPFKINFAVGWAAAHRKRQGRKKGAVLWVWHQEMGSWLYEELLRYGVEDVLYCPAGSLANSQIVDPANSGKIVVASISAHGTGKNLQHFQHQLFVQWPRSPRQAEQTLGRTHRNGQEADTLYIYTCNRSVFDQMNFASCLNDALYIHQSTGNRQKVIYGRYDPLPAIFPHAVLRERGFEVKPLASSGEQALVERFKG